MHRGIVLLVVAYGFSQFYRAFLAVLTPVLQSDLGAGPDDLALASGVWFITFALMQIPVGEALDRIGPRLTAAVIFGLGAGGGAAGFALAQTPFHITLAMGLIGIGCAPILMAAYFILAREFPIRVFATLAGAMIGLGALGNILGSAPLAWAVAAFGWRETMWALAGLAVLVAVALALAIRDPVRIPDAPRGTVIDVLRMRAIWPVLTIMFVAYAPAAVLRGLWVGPYLRDVFGADTDAIGRVTLVMALAMIAGNFAYGPLDRLLHTRKWVIFGGNAILCAAIAALAVWPAAGVGTATLLLAVAGFAGASFPMIVAHGRAFLPPHLTGRGVTLINLFGIGAAGIMQFVTGPLWRMSGGEGFDVTRPFSILFGFLAATVALGLIVFLRAEDRTD